jgi:hypothetical protein
VVLREVAAQEPSAPSWQFLQERWAAVKARAAAARTDGDAGGDAGGADAFSASDEAASLLLVISHTTAGCPRTAAEALARELLAHMLSFQLPPAAAGAHVTALFRLTAAAPTGAPGSSAAAPRAASVGPPEAWCQQLYAAAQEHLRHYINSRAGGGGAAEPLGGPAGGTQAAAAGLSGARPAAGGGAPSDHSACVAIFTVGQAALLRVARPPAGLTLLLQALTAHRFLATTAAAAGAAGTQQGPGEAPSQDAPSHQRLLAGAATQLQDADGDGAHAGGSGGRPVPAAIQGHTWTALGKVCLVDEALAKKVVPLFVQVRRSRGRGGGAMC